MAAFVQDVITFNTTTGNKAATITPAADGLLVVFCALSGVTAAPTVTDDQGGIYDLIRSGLRNASASGEWVFVRTARCASVAHVVTMSNTGADTGGGLDVIEVSGMSRAGVAAVRTSGLKNNIASGGVPTCILDQAALTANPVLTVLASQDAGNTAINPTGYTARNTGSYTVPTCGLGVHTRDSGETTATITWGGTETNNSGTVAVELDISVTPPYLPHARLRTIGPVLTPRRG